MAETMTEASGPSLPTHLTKRIRSACDRCHSQKLRCRKLPDSGQCVRCAKARAQCVFSPANRGFRSNPEAERVAQSAGNGVVESISSSNPSEPEKCQETSTSPEGPDASANGLEVDTTENNCMVAFG